MQPYEYVIIVTNLATLLSLFIGGYKLFHDPAEKSDKNIGVMEASCILKHGRIDEVIVEMKKKFDSIDNTLMLLKENDMKHIEQEMRKMSEYQTKILTILQYRDGIKVEEVL